MNLKRITDKTILCSSKTYLVLEKQRKCPEGYKIDPFVFEFAQWSLAMWDGASMTVEDGSGHYTPPVSFEDLEAVFNLPEKYDDFHGMVS